MGGILVKDEPLWLSHRAQPLSSTLIRQHTRATSYVTGGKLSATMGSVATTFWGLALSLVILLPLFAGLSLTTNWFTIALEGWYAVSWMAILASTIAYLLWYFAIDVGCTSRTGSLLFAMPVFGLIMAVIILGESITPKMLMICLCIITGAYIAQKHTK